MSNGVGIVAVSHSPALAEAAVALAMEMVYDAPPTVKLAAGTADGGLGTDASRVAQAIQEADNGQGVVVIMDLGSAILSAEMALEFLESDIDVRLVGAPFVEGLLAAVVRAAGGATLDEVAREASLALGAKTSHLGESPVEPVDNTDAGASATEESASTHIRNVGGLHARPAAQIAATASGFTANATLATAVRGPVDARSPIALATLNARPGDSVTVAATGDDAADAVAALIAQIDQGFGEDLVAPAEPVRVAPRPAPMRLGVSPGRVVGRVRQTGARVAPPEPRGSIAPADRADAASRVDEACAHVAQDYRDRAQALVGERAAVMVSTAAVAADPAISGAASRLVTDSGVDPEQAVWDTVGQISAAYRDAGGVLAERVTDLLDVRDRVVLRLRGQAAPDFIGGTEPFVLVAEDLAPADTAGLDPATCLAIITELGAPTSHSAIIAREIGIPAVVGMTGATDWADGTEVLVDGSTGEVIVNPSDSERASALGRVEWERFAGPGQTTDEHKVLISANVGSARDAMAGVEWGAEGVGLFRTEFCFLERSEEPTIEEQIAKYRAVLSEYPNQRVVVRTLDAGSDKPLPFLTSPGEANPALGVRGFRTARRDHDVLTRQLEAIAAAAEGTNADLWVMAPMIATVEEAQEFVGLARAAGIERAGIMVETPSAALMAEELCDVVDFISIGTNDLAQYTMAADRMATELADLTDAWQPALLRSIALVAAAGKKTGTPVGVCGEAAANPELAAVLVGMGVTSLSMSPRAIPPVGASIASVTMADCRMAADAALSSPSVSQARSAAKLVLTEAQGG
ncbi:phosphoenolpyruvate--protein phosphotransferase [Demequina aurantiaca]|uniref:phosphoenolpyruvate--protein phosphotransferase n=1 Tax=Demequina aurantiaca TaxID=676200 RepID=UPI003D329576